ncbi:choice-of-anchor P family protein [Methylobacter sp. YRD-M1]|uniref:choice-of-anchor P family protein n=1 Tax=Methylobacter sp. YRD-M1 TaxID=2911520 RepID=UPI00227AA6B0|nr:choice-of-anchor P family protein [Methylobacter sp. YRD-M1]WAK02547.1 hypothetical protein LZ558_01790 [Methylobacter sp. YRD-M1]
MKRQSYFLGTAALALASVAFAPSAGAAIVSANSEGYGLSVNLAVLGSNLLTVTAPAGVSGTAPAPYSLNDALLNLNVGVTIPLLAQAHASADTISGSANSNVDGSAGSKTSSASGGVEDLSINADLLTILGLESLLELDNLTLSSSAEITGDYGNMIASGSANITSLSLNILGQDIQIDADANAGPNSIIDLSVLGLVGATLILNEQIADCSDSFCSMTVNALRLSLNGLNNIFGTDIIIGHAYAEMSAENVSAVPVPAAVWLFGSAMVGLAGISRRKTNASEA